MLAMHMANELLSIPVSALTLAAAFAIVAAAAVTARKKLDPQRLPLMGVMGAFVFAGQMINFTLPGMPGTSGHLGGGVLLAIILGPAAGIVTMAGILIVQCLLFQDGGLLALGCNILNMGVVPCLTGWGLYKLLLGRNPQAPSWRLYLSTWLACVAAVVAGAMLVPVEAGASGVLNVPLGHFEAVMISVHLLIGFIEGLITFAVIAYLRQVRPEALSLVQADATRRRLGKRSFAVSMIATALVLAGVVSWFASPQPDGLEWSYRFRNYGQADANVAPQAAMEKVTAWQSRWSLMPDYSKRSADLGQEPSGDTQAQDRSWPHMNGWGSVAGVAGTAVTLGIVYAVAVVLRKRRRRGSGSANESSGV